VSLSITWAGISVGVSGRRRVIGEALGQSRWADRPHSSAILGFLKRRGGTRTPGTRCRVQRISRLRHWARSADIVVDVPRGDGHSNDVLREICVSSTRLERDRFTDVGDHARGALRVSRGDRACSPSTFSDWATTASPSRDSTEFAGGSRRSADQSRREGPPGDCHAVERIYGGFTCGGLSCLDQEKSRLAASVMQRRTGQE
jgi:hypothetical protein